MLWLDMLLAQPRVVRVHVSLDALQNRASHAVRGRDGWYTKAMSYIQTARRINPDLRIVINAIINKYNSHEILQYFQLDCDQVNYLNLKGECPQLQVSRGTERAVAAKIGNFVGCRQEQSRESVGVTLLVVENSCCSVFWSRDSLVRFSERRSYGDGRFHLNGCSARTERGQRAGSGPLHLVATAEQLQQVMRQADQVPLTSDVDQAPQ